MAQDTLKIAICSIHQQGLDLARFLAGNGFEVSCLITISKKLAEKNNASGKVDYLDQVIPVRYCKKYSLNSEEDLDFFEKEKFDILLLGGWQRLIPETILKTLKIGALGQHGSPYFLPMGRGRSPINWAILNGDKKLTWNLIWLKAGVDDGDIAAYRDFQITEFDTVQTIYYKVSIVIKRMVLSVLGKIKNGEPLDNIKQEGEPSYYGQRTPSMGEINWDKSSHEIHRLVRATTEPYPCAFFTANEVKHFIIDAQPFDDFLDYHKSKNGEVVEVFGSKLLIKCGSGLLLINKYKC